MEYTVVILREDSTVRKVGCIDFDNCRFRRIKVTENRGSAESLFQRGECVFGFRRPLELDFFSSEIRERSRNLTVAFDETPIEIGETEEYLDIVRRLWTFPFENCFNFGGVHVNTLRGDHESEERDFCSVELAFLWLDIETGFLETFEDQTDMSLMFFEGIGINQEIIEVDHEEFIEVLAKFVVYEVLECSRRVT